MISATTAKRAIFGSVIAILVLTVLEFPPPIGFETRPQTDVSPIWLIFFVAILVIEVATVPLVYKRPKFGQAFGVTAGIVNIVQVVSDQAHLMQPEVAPLGYTMLELTVTAVSLALVYFSLALPTRGTDDKARALPAQKPTEVVRG
jgi:hypothetical protein